MNIKVKLRFVSSFSLPSIESTATRCANVLVRVSLICVYARGLMNGLQLAVGESLTPRAAVVLMCKVVFYTVWAHWFYSAGCQVRWSIWSQDKSRFSLSFVYHQLMLMRPKLIMLCDEHGRATRRRDESKNSTIHWLDNSFWLLYVLYFLLSVEIPSTFP